MCVVRNWIVIELSNDRPKSMSVAFVFQKNCFCPEQEKLKSGFCKAHLNAAQQWDEM